MAGDQLPTPSSTSNPPGGTSCDSAHASASQSQRRHRPGSPALRGASRPATLSASQLLRLPAFKARRDLGDAVRVGKDAAARRERDLADELRHAGGDEL